MTTLARSRSDSETPPVHALTLGQPRSEDLAAFLPKVGIISREIWIRYAYLLRGRMEYEDLYHFGVEGLMRARRQWRDHNPGTFWNYAEHVVRGYMIDSIRSDHIIPWQRPDRTDKHGRLFRARLKPYLVPMPDYDYREFARHDKYKDPMLRKLMSRILTDREALILHMHFWEDTNMTEIANVFGVSEARISQICKDVCRRLRAGMEFTA